LSAVLLQQPTAMWVAFGVHLLIQTVYNEQKKFDSADRLTSISHCTNTEGSHHPHLRISAVLFQRPSNSATLTTQPPNKCSGKAPYAGYS